MTAPRHRHRLHPGRLWDILQEPRAVTASMIGAYACALLAGISALISPPNSIVAQLGILTYGWAIFLVIGGILGVASVPRGYWWLEKAALVSVATGLAIYIATLLQIHIIDPGNRLPQAFALGVGACTILGRYFRIRRASLDPVKAAARIHDHDGHA